MTSKCHFVEHVKSLARKKNRVHFMVILVVLLFYIQWILNIRKKRERWRIMMYSSKNKGIEFRRGVFDTWTNQHLK